MRSTMHFLSGSLAVYAFMAACSGGNKSNDGPSGGGTTAAGGALNSTSGASTSTGGSTGGVTNMMMNPVPDASAETKSGTRLKARYYVGADGSKQFSGWRDTMRNEDCSFSRAEDGVIRCLPTPGYASYFADPGCSQPLGMAVTPSGSACPGATLVAPTYVESLSCGGFKYYKAGATTTPAMVYSGVPGACSATAAPAIYTFYTTTYLAPTEFASATEQVE